MTMRTVFSIMDTEVFVIVLWVSEALSPALAVYGLVRLKIWALWVSVVCSLPVVLYFMASFDERFDVVILIAVASLCSAPIALGHGRQTLAFFLLTPRWFTSSLLFMNALR